MINTVPPVQVDKISQFRSVLFKFKRKARQLKKTIYFFLPHFQVDEEKEKEAAQSLGLIILDASTNQIFFLLRLQDELLAVSLKQNVGRMHQDMQNMSEWCAAFADYGQRQAGLDIKYVQDRYERGCAKVKSHCDTKLKLLQQESFRSSQNDILSFALPVGNQPRLDFTFLVLWVEFSLLLDVSSCQSQDHAPCA